jgi:histone H3/H4
MSDNDDELCIPRSAMYKLVKELVPQVRLSGEAKDLIVTSCNEFIHLLASESNTVCENQSKKLILPDHVLLALDNLGFGEYKQDCVEVMKQMQEEVDKRKKLRNKLEKPGIPEEELLRQQNLLFAEARKQQQMIENAEEWSKVQQEAQLALQRQASSSSQNSINFSNSSSNISGNNMGFNQTCPHPMLGNNNNHIQNSFNNNNIMNNNGNTHNNLYTTQKSKADEDDDYD